MEMQFVRTDQGSEYIDEQTDDLTARLIDLDIPAFAIQHDPAKSLLENTDWHTDIVLGSMHRVLDHPDLHVHEFGGVRDLGDEWTSTSPHVDAEFDDGNRILDLAHKPSSFTIRAHATDVETRFCATMSGRLSAPADLAGFDDARRGDGWRATDEYISERGYDSAIIDYNTMLFHRAQPSIPFESDWVEHVQEPGDTVFFALRSRNVMGGGRSTIHSTERSEKQPARVYVVDCPITRIYPAA